MPSKLYGNLDLIVKDKSENETRVAVLNNEWVMKTQIQESLAQAGIKPDNCFFTSNVNQVLISKDETLKCKIFIADLKVLEEFCMQKSLSLKFLKDTV